MNSIPLSLSPFFQEYDITTLTPEKDAHTIIERVLQFGNRTEIKWLFEVYPKEQIIDWINNFGMDKLPQPHRTFWKIILDDHS